MKARILEERPFYSFRVEIDIENEDQLCAFLAAVGRMTNGHGIDLYELLKGKAIEFGIGT